MKKGKTLSYPSFLLKKETKQKKSSAVSADTKVLEPLGNDLPTHGADPVQVGGAFGWSVGGP